MKRVISLVTVLAALALGTSALAAAFTAGNIVVVRIDGAGAPGGGVLTNIGNEVFLDEYTTNGPTPTLVQSILIRTNYFGANSPLILNGLASLEGLISRSADGRFIALAGYGATVGQFTNVLVANTFNTEVPRIVGLIDGNGNVDTTTAQTNSTVNQESFRTAYTDEGTNIWFAGDTGGIRFTTRGSPLATQLTNTYANIHQIARFDNKLYFSIQSGSFLRMGVVTNNMPVTADVATNSIVIETNLTGTTVSLLPDPCAFVFLNVQGGASNDTLYVADDTPNNSGTNVLKFCLVGGTWTFKGGILATGARGITGVVGPSGKVFLYITGAPAQLGGGFMWRYTDSAGFNADMTNAGGDLGDFYDWRIGPPNTRVFRGVALVPQGGEPAISVGQLSVGPALDYFATSSSGCSVSETDKYSLANIGANSISWTATCPSNWVGFSPSSGTITSGGSVTVSVFGNANAASLLSGTNTTTIAFNNTTSSPNDGGSTTRFVQLVEKDQSISPTTDFFPSGQPGGPFIPSNKVYTLFNGSGSDTMIVTNTYAPSVVGTNWLSYSLTNFPSMPGCSQTAITFSVTSAATNLPQGNYQAAVIFSNASQGVVIDSINVVLTVGGLFFCDDFSTFTQNSILAGQNNWQNNGQGSVNEPFVTNGVVFLTAISGPAAADEPFKNMPKMTNLTDNAFAGLVMVVTSAPPSSTTSPARMMCFYQGQNPGSGQSTPFARDHVTVRDTGTGTFFRFGARANGTTANAWVFGTHTFAYGSTNRVIIQGNVTNTDTYVYVNPSSATLDTGTAEVAMHNTTSFQFDTNFGAFGICNTFGGSGADIAGIAFSKICVNSNYADVYNSITPAAPTDPYNTWQNQYFGSTTAPRSLGGADPDLDGMSNTNEFLAGFDPTVNTAYLHIITVAKSSTNIVVMYLGANGNGTTTPPSSSRTNVLEFTNGKANGSFTNNFVSADQTNILSGGSGLGTVTSFVDTNGTSGAQKYYRVRVLVP